jgi:hypothetical protein
MPIRRRTQFTVPLFHKTIVREKILPTKYRENIRMRRHNEDHTRPLDSERTLHVISPDEIRYAPRNNPEGGYQLSGEEINTFLEEGEYIKGRFGNTIEISWEPTMPSYSKR